MELSFVRLLHKRLAELRSAFIRRMSSIAILCTSPISILLGLRSSIEQSVRTNSWNDPTFLSNDDDDDEPVCVVESRSECAPMDAPPSANVRRDPLTLKDG